MIISKKVKRDSSRKGLLRGMQLLKESEVKYAEVGKKWPMMQMNSNKSMENTHSANAFLKMSFK